MGKSQRKQKERKEKKREYKMTLAGQLVKHLGLQMYSGAVPAIAELISNAYDAMARNVWIDIPLDKPIDQAKDEISVRDDGHGMSYKECNELYLCIGYERRARMGEWTEPYNGLKSRKVQGRKGIGKLSGFGIANKIEIRTIRNKEISHFAMDYEEITKSSSFVSKDGYTPEPLKDDGKKASKRNETRVTLSQLKIVRAIPFEQFVTGLARRLLVLDANFRVHVNGRIIDRGQIPFQFRFPTKKNEWQTETLENEQEVQWWAGFCKEPIKDDMQRGFVVFVRGKLAQEPWFFDLSGGAWGQHGMQYMTGEIRADFLDDKVDLIATDRATVRWEDPLAVPLKKWGLRKVRGLLEKWVAKRTEEKHQSPIVIRYLSFADRLPERERLVFRKAVDRICSIPQLDKDEAGRDLADELVEFVYNALTNRTFLDIIRQLNAAKPEDRARFEEVLSEWGIIEAINTAQIVKGRVEIIHKFCQMLEDGVPEKPDMQEYMKKNPWLIEPDWTMLYHEKSLDKLLCNHFNIQKTKSKEGRKRVDFFCIGDGSSVAHVIELKSPRDIVGTKELDQLRDYVYFLREELVNKPLDQAKKRTSISGLLICREIRDANRQYANDLQKMDLKTWTYQDLLRTTLRRHRDFLKVVKDRAPADDPRIAELDDIEGEMAFLPGTKTRSRGKKRPLKKKNKKKHGRKPKKKK